MGQQADHREQIYRKNEEETWARRLTTESKSIGKMKRRHGPEGWHGEGSRGSEADEATEEVQQRV